MDFYIKNFQSHTLPLRFTNHMDSIKKLFLFATISALPTASLLAAEALIVDANTTFKTEEVYVTNEPEGEFEEYSKIIINSGTLSDFSGGTSSVTITNTNSFDNPPTDIENNAALGMLIKKDGVYSTSANTSLYGGIISVAGEFNSTNNLYINYGDSTNNVYFKVDKGASVTVNSIEQGKGASFSTTLVEGTLKVNSGFTVSGNTAVSALKVDNGGNLTVVGTLSHTDGIMEIGSANSTATVSVGSFWSEAGRPSHRDKDDKLVWDSFNGNCLQINKGSTLNLNVGGTKDTISQLRVTKVYGTLNVESGVVKAYDSESFTMYGGTINVKAGAAIHGGDVNSGNYVFTTHEGHTYINVYGKGENAGKFSTYSYDGKVNNNLRINDYSSTNSTLELWGEDKHAVVTGTVTFLKTGKLILKSKDVIVGKSGKTSITLGSGSKATIDVDADNVFGSVSVQKDTNLTIDLADSDAIIGFTSFSKGYNYNALNLTINEFDNYRVFFTNADFTLETLNEMCNITLIQNSETMDLKKLNLVLTLSKYNHSEYGTIYWLNTVPEPAEWAAIFGAIALAFAIYRKRSKK